MIIKDRDRPFNRRALERLLVCLPRCIKYCVILRQYPSCGVISAIYLRHGRMGSIGLNEEILQCDPAIACCSRSGLRVGFTKDAPQRDQSLSPNDSRVQRVWPSEAVCGDGRVWMKNEFYFSGRVARQDVCSGLQGSECA